MNIGSGSVHGTVFAAFAQNDFKYWTQLHQATVHHNTYGEGIVVSVVDRPKYIPSITIRFAVPGEVTFNSNGFINGVFTQVFLPPSLQPKFDEWKAEEAALSQFRTLAKKYNVPEKQVRFSILLPVLLKLEARDNLEQSEIDWLVEQRLFNLLATYSYRRFSSSGDLWQLVKACSYLRDAGLPLKAIEISEKESESKGIADQRALSALLTTRGGSYRDCGDLKAARDAANQANLLTPESPYPHNLLGAIYYSEGLPSDGDRHFEIAASLGGNVKVRDAEIYSVLRKSSVDIQAKIASYLLAKDPQKYGWAAHFSHAKQET